MIELKNNLTCTGCSLLCDDIAVQLENGIIKTTHQVCARGYGRFYQVNFKYRLLEALKRVGGVQEGISYEDALKDAVKLLKNAKRPVFFGWTSATSEAQQKGVQLAKKYKAVLECASTCSVGGAIEKFLTQNIMIPSLTDIRDNADVLLFWGSNPTASHIRLLSKYSLLARGTNTSRGIEDRTVITIDIRNTDMSKFSEEFLQVEPGKDKQLIESLIKIIDGKSFSEESVAKIPRKTLYNVANILKDARFGVMFFGNGFVKTEENINLLIQFYEILKGKGVKFGIIPLDGGYNAIGFNKNLKNMEDLGLNADFMQTPAVQDHNLLINLLKSGEMDLLFVVGADPISNLPFGISKLIAKLKIVSIDFQQTPTTRLSDIVIPTTIPGVESGGTSYRLDFEPISLKPFMKPPQRVHSDEEILGDLLKMS